MFKGSSFLTLMIDDFHNINAIKTPKGRQLSNAVHMATLMVDVHNHEAVQRPHTIHRDVMVTVPGNQPQSCKGGICSDAVIEEIQLFWREYCLYTFLESAPESYREVNPCILQKSLKELR